MEVGALDVIFPLAIYNKAKFHRLCVWRNLCYDGFVRDLDVLVIIFMT